MPYCFHVASESTATELAESLHTFLDRDRPRFLVTEITDQAEGHLPPETWYFFRDKATRSEVVEAQRAAMA